MLGESREQLVVHATREVKSGRELTSVAQARLHEIQSLVQEATGVATEISQASSEQTKATQLVSGSMQTISDFAVQSLIGANETRRAAKDLVDLSHQLNEAISRFRVAARAEVLPAIAPEAPSWKTVPRPDEPRH